MKEVIKLKRIRCRFCKLTLLNRKTLSAHIKRLHLKKSPTTRKKKHQTICHICGKTFAAYNVRRHVQAVHLNEIMGQKLGFRTMGGRKRAVIKETGSNQIDCYFCGKKFLHGRTSSYRNHIKKVHLNEKIKITENVNMSDTNRKLLLGISKMVYYPTLKTVLYLKSLTNLPRTIILSYFRQRRKTTGKQFTEEVDSILTKEQMRTIKNDFESKRSNRKEYGANDDLVLRIANKFSVKKDVIWNVVKRRNRNKMHNKLDRKQLDDFYAECGYPTSFQIKMLADKQAVGTLCVKQFFKSKLNQQSNTAKEKSPDKQIRSDIVEPVCRIEDEFEKRRTLKRKIDFAKKKIDEELVTRNKYPKKCHFCDVFCQNNRNYMTHVKTHLKERPCKVCQLCGKYIANSLSIHDHLEECGIENGETDWLKGQRFKCGVCMCVFNDTHLLTLHINTEHQCRGVDSMLCTKCDSSFSNGQELIEHVLECQRLLSKDASKSVKNNKKRKERYTINYPCDLCSTVCSTINDIKLHFRKFHRGQKFQHTCTECNRVFHTLTSMLTHLDIHQRSKIVCKEDNCRLSFLTDNGLRTHTALIHKAGKFFCTYTPCDHFCMSLHAIKSHELIKHQGLGKSKCRYCNLLFSSRNLRSHEKEMHENVILSCDVSHCDFQTRTPSVMRRHKSKHVPFSNINHSDRPWKYYEDVDFFEFYKKDRKLINMAKQKIQKKSFHVYVCIAVPICYCSSDDFDIKSWLKTQKNTRVTIPMYIGKMTRQYVGSKLLISDYHLRKKEKSSIGKLLLSKTHRVFFIQKWDHSTIEEAEKQEAILQYYISHRYAIFKEFAELNQILFSPLFQKLEKKKLMKKFTQTERWNTILIAKMIRRPLFCLDFDCSAEHDPVPSGFPVSGLYHLDTTRFEEIKD